MATVLALRGITSMKMLLTLQFDHDLGEEEINSLIGDIVAQVEEDQEGHGRGCSDFRYMVTDDSDVILYDNHDEGESL